MYVDWVGTDFYREFPNFAGLQRFYSEYPGKQFAFGEWALWNGGDPGWVDSLFSLIATHRRVKMALYNQGEREKGPFRLSRYPRDQAAAGPQPLHGLCAGVGPRIAAPMPGRAGCGQSPTSRVGLYRWIGPRTGQGCRAPTSHERRFPACQRQMRFARRE